VKADIQKTVGYYEEGGTTIFTLEGNASGLTAEDATTYAAATVSGSAVTPGVAYFYTKAPSLALVSTSITGLTGTTGSLSPQQADAKIKINVTAQGGGIYIPVYSATAASSGIVMATSTVAGDVTTAYTFDSNATLDSTGVAWLVPSGGTKWFEASAMLTNNAAALNVYALINSVKWGTTVAAVQQETVANDWTWGLTDFKTSNIYLQAAL